MERRKPRLKIPFFKRMWRKYGFPRIRRTRKYQKLRMKVMGVWIDLKKASLSYLI